MYKDGGIMVDRFNQAFYESTIFLRISIFSASITLIIFLIGFFVPSWKYLEFTHDFSTFAVSDPSSFENSNRVHKDESSNSKMSSLSYDDWEKEMNFSYLEEIEFTEHILQTLNLSYEGSSDGFYSTYGTSESFTAYVIVGLWETRVCTKFLSEENCIPPFKTQGFNWIRRSRGFCTLALGMSVLTVVLILMCLFLSIAADMLLTHVMTLLTSILSVSSIAVGILIFTSNHTKLDEHTMMSNNNLGVFQMSVSKVSWACWLSASATPSGALTVLFLGLNIVFF